MSNPNSLGAHGKPATFTGDDGCKAPDGQARAVEKSFSGMGSNQGGPSPIPSKDKSGAFTEDESARCYTGNPRDAGCGSDRE